MKVYVVTWTDEDRYTEIVSSKYFTNHEAARTFADQERLEFGLNPSMWDWHCYRIEELSLHEE